jgi:hypothetical protein
MITFSEEQIKKKKKYKTIKELLTIIKKNFNLNNFNIK